MPKKNIPAVLLAGGYGTRFKPLSLNFPKPMAPFLGKPILEHQIELLKDFGFNHIIMALLYQPDKITRYFKDGSEFGVTIDYLIQPQDRGTAGSVKQLEEKLTDTFFVFNGDVISDPDLDTFYQFHKSNGGLASICLAKVGNPLPFGMAILNEKKRIQRFIEKPAQAEVVSDLVNAGIYLFEPDILRFIPDERPFSFATDLFPLLLKQGISLYGFEHEGYWRDIGDLRVYLQAQIEILSGKARLRSVSRETTAIQIADDVHIPPSARLEGGVRIGKGCQIGERARLVNCVLGDRVKVGVSSEIVDSVIWSDVTIGPGTRIVNDVIANGTRIGENVYLDDNVFVGANCVIEDFSTIASNVKIWPKKVIETGSTVTSSLVWGDRWLHEVFTGSHIIGVVNQEVSPEFGAKVGAAFGALLGTGSKVLVGWDGSPAARMINRSIICGLMSSGVNVGDLRVTPLPVLRYTLQSGNYQGGVYVSLSSQRENVLDVLFLRSDGQDITAQEAKTVERLFIQEDFPRVALPEIGQLEFPVRMVEAYQENFLKNLAVRQIGSAKFKIVVDYSFGPASLILPSILGHFDCEVVALNAYLDYKHQPRNWADFRYSLLQLGNIVVSLKTDVGFLIDPAAERLFVVDDRGDYLKNEYLLLLFTKLFLNIFRHSAIGVPASAPMAISQIAGAYGTQVVPIELDLRAISGMIHDKQLAFIGDGNGRFIFPEFHFASDGMFAMAKILELLAMNHVALSSLKKEIKMPIMDHKEISCPKDKMGLVLRSVIESASENVSSTMEGVKIFFENGWILLSPDSQKPLLHIIAEADSRQKLELRMKHYIETVESFLRDF